MLHAGIYGLGRWGQRIVEAVSDSERIRVTRGLVRHPDRVAAFAQNYGLALATRDAELLGDDTLDALILATPHTLHVEQTVAAAAAGKHVFCEKPLALRLEDARRAVAACRAAGRVLAVGHDKRFWPSMIALRELVAAGTLGTILHVEGHTSNQNAAAFAAWRGNPTESPAGGMTGTGVHMLDALVSLCGPVAEVTARLTQRATLGDPRDVIGVLLAFECGVSGTLAAVRSTPFYWRAHVFGDRASAEALGPTTLVIRGPGDRVERRDYAEGDAVRAELEAFAAAVTGQRPYPMTTAEMLATVAAFEAIVRSVERGGTVAVESA